MVPVNDYQNLLAAISIIAFVMFIGFMWRRTTIHTEYMEQLDWAHALVNCLEKEDLSSFPKGVSLKGIHRRAKLLNKLGIHAEVSADKESLFIDHGDQTITLVIH